MAQKFKNRRNLTYRVPTRTARKTEFTAQDQFDLELFHTDIVQIMTIEKIPLADVHNFDQTNVRLVDPQKKTIYPISVKEVAVIQPRGEKEGFTINLMIRADGTKVPATIVFKFSKEQ